MAHEEGTGAANRLKRKTLLLVFFPLPDPVTSLLQSVIYVERQ